jgi:hypothetical protein
VAQSGKKHTLPWAQLNSGENWVVRFEAQDVRSNSCKFAYVLYHAATLYIMGLGRQEILTCRPKVSSVVKAGTLEARREIEALARYSNSGVLELALFSFTKDSVNDARREAVARLGVQDGIGGNALGKHECDTASGLVDSRA